MIQVAIGEHTPHAGAASLTRLAETDDARVRTERVRDRDAVHRVRASRAAFAIIAGTITRRDRQSGLRQRVLDVELWALTVSSASSVYDVSDERLRQVLTGEVTDWRGLGFGAGPITLVAPADRDVTRRLLDALGVDDELPATTQRVASDRDALDRVATQTGTLALVRFDALRADARTRALAIAGQPPSAAAFAAGEYSAGLPVTLVTSGEPSGAARRLLDALERAQ